VPFVADGLLHLSAAGPLSLQQRARATEAGLVGVGSPDWFHWLGLETTTSFSLQAPTGIFTARKEPRSRGGAY